MKEHFTQEMILLKRRLAAQTAAAENALGRALRAIASRDVELANDVCESDYAIDCEEIRIEEDCLKILALYQPVASDLRTIITVLKINGEIERIADMAANIAARTRAIAESGVPADKEISFSEMAKAATAMLKNALDSFAYRDPESATAVIASDQHVDDLHKANLERIQKIISTEPSLAAYYMSCITISKNLERIADVATNIAEDVIYLERGKIVRHSIDN
ncbi:MAG: phosphate signaling complex protein PhoU [Opitutae bacterium]|nr:phosphate signaling complex protein PhoU [Opitutae bacterium]MCD8299213.1 phosphate signaling complex protein PhoU [Opitutae bacterium]